MKLVGRLVLAALFFAGIIWFKSFDRQSKSDDAVDQAISIVASLTEYAEHQQYFDEKLAAYHERAFEVAYSNTRRKASLDERSYRIVLFKQFMDDAESSGNTEVHEAMLRELRKIQP